MDKPLEELNNLDDINLYIDEKQKELQGAVANREKIESERYVLMRDIINFQLKSKEKQIEKIELDKGLSKAKAVCTTLSLEVKRAQAKYWNLRNG